MAIAVSNVKPIRTGNLRSAVATITFDSSYPTGGESLSPSLLGLQNIEYFSVDSSPGYTFKYDYTNSKILVYFPRGAVTGTLAATVNSGATPVTSASANGAIITLAGNPAVSAGAGVEVTNATDLSSLVIRIYAIGF
jgi:hypothetical protein